MGKVDLLCCETLIVYVCISGLWFKNAHVEKVHGKSL